MDGAGLRKLDRKHVLLNATIISLDGSQDVRIRDLSQSGAQIFCDRPPAENCDVIFKRGRLFVAARIAWANKTVAGLQFYRQRDPSDLSGRG